MDIFVIKVNSEKNVEDDLLLQFLQRPISDEKTRKTHCFSYLMLDRILREVYQLQDRKIIFDNKKPMLDSKLKNFSITHSENYIVLAFSDSNCGVDIEKIKTRDYIKIAKRMHFDSKTEEEFYEDWTTFEAQYKLGEEIKSKKTFKLDDYYLTVVSNNMNEEFNLFYQE